jgi:hypothetical protein
MTYLTPHKRRMPAAPNGAAFTAARKGAAFNSHGREAVGPVSKQIEARRADIFIGDFKFNAAPSALVVLDFARSTALRPWLLHNEPAALFLNALPWVRV